MKTKCVVILGVFILLVGSGALFADDLVMFNYQGRVRVQGQPFNGTGYFKFAIVNLAGNRSLWSNDLTSVHGSEPVASVSVTVVDGIFNVMVGDPDLGMEPINRSVFNYPGRIKLRIWFSDGTHGFQRLLPDRRIVNPELMGIMTGTSDFTIYVDGVNGDDDNSGLTTGTAKRTIQAAVDVLPERLRCNVTIDIADGIYREEVKVFGITVLPGKFLTFLGDENWTPSSPGNPAVRITGADEDTTHTRVRDNPFYVIECTNVKVIGILFDYGNVSGLTFWKGHNYAYNCKSAHNKEVGFRVSTNARAHFYDCLAEQNDMNGFYIYYNAILHLWDCISINNGYNGVWIDSLSKVAFYGSGNFSGNGRNGIYVSTLSAVQFLNFGDSIYHGQIRDNARYGIEIRWDSHTLNHTSNTFSNNALGNVHTIDGGHTY